MFNHTQKNVTIASMTAINVGILAYSFVSILPKIKSLKNDSDYYKDKYDHWSKIAGERYATIEAMHSVIRERNPELAVELRTIIK